MKKFVLTVAVLTIGYTAISQVGIGNTDPKATLDISASNVATPINTDGILIPRVDNFPTINPTIDQDGLMLFATGAGAPAKGFYYWDQNTSSWVSIEGSATTDADWFLEGTTNIPTAITDNIYTQGEVEIDQGKLIITPVDDMTGGIDLTKSITTNTASTLRNVAVSTNITGTTNITQFRSGFTGNGTGQRTGFSNVFNGNGAAQTTGYSNSFDNDAAVTMIGMTNFFNTTSTNTKTGVQNILISNAQNGPVFGTRNLIVGGTGTIYGARTEITNGSGFQHGVSTVLTNGTGTRFGYRADLIGTGGGTDYGVYSDVEDVSNGFAGYFVGRVSLGNLGTNRYLMPATDGTSGQVVTTDGAGNLTFQTPVTGVEKIDDLLDGKSDNDGSNNGSSIFLGINAGAADNSNNNQNVGIGYQSMASNIAGIANTSLGYNALTSNTTGAGNIGIGWNSLQNTTTGGSNVSIGYRAGQVNTTGFANTYVGTSAGSFSTGDYNVSLGTSAGRDLAGDQNVAIGASAGGNTGSPKNVNGSVFLGHFAGYHETNNNTLYIDNTSANSSNALIYGEFGVNSTTIGNILRTNSEFQIGNPAGTGYALPTIDGFNGQVLTTNGAGQLTFTTLVSGSGTLDQAYDFGGAGAGRIINATSGAVEIQGAGGLRVEDDIVAAQNIVHDGDTNTFMAFTPDRIEFEAGGRNYMDIQHLGTEVTFNEDSTTSDLRVESNLNAHMLFVDGGSDGVGINNSNPNAELDVIGNVEVFGNMSHQGNLVSVTRSAQTTGAAIYAATTSSYNLASYSAIQTANDLTDLNVEINKYVSGGGGRFGLLIDGTDSDIVGDTGIKVDFNNALTLNYLAENIGFHYDMTYNGGASGNVYGFKADIEGTGTADKFGVYIDIPSASGGDNYGIYSNVQNATDYAGYFLGRTYVSGQIGVNVINPTFAIDLPNNATASIGQGRANAWTTYSDGRVKTNQKEITYGLQHLMKLTPKSYFHNNSTFNDGTLNILNQGEQTIGFIAQELYKIIPETVQKPEDEAKALWSVDYNKLMPVAVKAIQELNKKNEQLESKIKLLEIQISNYKTLEARLSALETGSTTLTEEIVSSEKK